MGWATGRPTLGRVKKEVFPSTLGTVLASSRWHNSVGLEGGASFMTEERARHYAKALAQNMGITFYAVRSREGRFLAVQIPSNDCEILATFAPPHKVRDTPQFREEQTRRAA